MEVRRPASWPLGQHRSTLCAPEASVSQSQSQSPHGAVTESMGFRVPWLWIGPQLSTEELWDLGQVTLPVSASGSYLHDGEDPCAGGRLHKGLHRKRVSRV